MNFNFPNVYFYFPIYNNILCMYALAIFKNANSGW